MKKILKLTAILLIFASTFTACEKIDLLNVDAFAIYAYAEGGTFQINVSSNGAWTAVVQDAENNSWITLDNASGTNSGVITVNIAENPLFETRNATIKVSMGSLNEFVLVEQEAKKCDLNAICGTELIIGKWELVEKRFSTSVFPPEAHVPNGYVEFRSDGRFGWFDYASNKFTLFETTYSFQDGAICERCGYLHGTLEFETWEEEWDGRIHRVWPFFPDRPSFFRNYVTFIDCNTLEVLGEHTLLYDEIFIYKRKR